MTVSNYYSFLAYCAHRTLLSAQDARVALKCILFLLSASLHQTKRRWCKSICSLMACLWSDFLLRHLYHFNEADQNEET